MRAVAAKSPSNDTSTKSSSVKPRYTPAPKSVPFFTGTNTFIQTKSICPCDGGCPKCTGIIQPKLTIGQPNDRYEQEADRVADQIMRMPEKKESLVNGHSSLVQRKAGCSGCMDEEEEVIHTKPIADQITPIVQRQAESEIEEEEEEEPVQLKSSTGKSPPVTAGLQSQIQSMRGNGQPLPGSTRAFFEPRFGLDFSQVRVHTGSKAADAAKSINSKAFTTGKDIVFGAGQYSPGTTAGKRLLGHELSHVVQQGKNSISTHLQALTEEEKKEDLKSEKYSGNNRLQKAFDNGPTLGIGESGDAVRLVQEGLVADGFAMPRSTKPTGEMDGIFGEETFSVVKKFQTKHLLSIDGIIGRETMGKLDLLALQRSPIPPKKLPPCPVNTQGNSRSFIGGSFFPIPMGFAIPGLTCAPRKPKVGGDLSRIRNVRITFGRRPRVIRQKGNLNTNTTSVILDQKMTATGAASVIGGPNTKDFTFGFVQICRPYDVMRSVHYSGITKDHVDFNASPKSRIGQPSRDHTGDWYQNKIPDPKKPNKYIMVDAKANPQATPPGRISAPVSVDFSDRPGVPFKIDREVIRTINGKSEIIYYQIVGVALQFFYFTAFVVKLPKGGGVYPLSTFYWDMRYCEAINGNLYKDQIGDPVNVSKPRYCLKEWCDQSEPGFMPLAVNKIIKKPCCNIVNENALYWTNVSNPGTYDIGCE